MKTAAISVALLVVIGVGAFASFRDRPAASVPTEPVASLAALPQSPGATPLSRPPSSAPTPSAASPRSREDWLRETARTWVRADLPGAAAWLLSLSETEAALVTDAMLEELGRDNVPAAITLAQALRQGVDDGRVEHLAQIWTEAEPAAAVAWISNLAPGPDRDRLLARAALVRVGHDSAEAARLISAMTAGPARDAAIAATIARLRIYDPAKADSWAALMARN
jgi:hypothetical protein